MNFASLDLKNRIICFFIVVLLVLVNLLDLAAQDLPSSVESLNIQSKPVSLTQAINVALANNTEIKRSLLTLKDADQQVRLAWSEVLPEVNGNMSYARNIQLPFFFFPIEPANPQSPLQAIPAGEDNNWTGSLTVEQTLFRGEAFVGINSSQLFKAAQAENLRATSQQVVTDTRLAYYNVLVAEEQFRLQKLTVDRLKKNLKENRSRYKAGLIDDFAVLQVEVQLSNQEPQLTQAKYAVQQAYRQLKLTMNIPMEMDIEVEGDLSSFTIMGEKIAARENADLKKIDRMTPYNYGEKQNRELIEIAAEARGDIRMLDKQEDLKEREAKAIKSRFLPTISTSYNMNWRAEEPGSPNFFGNEKIQRVRTQSLLVNLSVPVFQGFERSANLQIAKIEQKDIKLQQEFALRSAKNEIQSAEESLNQAIETSPAREKALKQARRGYNRAKARLEQGIGTQLDVTEAEFQLRQAEVNYAQMVFNYLSAKARYDLAIGMVPFADRVETEIN